MRWSASSKSWSNHEGVRSAAAGRLWRKHQPDVVPLALPQDDEPAVGWTLQLAFIEVQVCGLDRFVVQVESLALNPAPCVGLRRREAARYQQVHYRELPTPSRTRDLSGRHVRERPGLETVTS